MTISLTQDVWIAGVKQVSGTSLTLSASLEAELVTGRKATFTTSYSGITTADTGPLADELAALGVYPALPALTADSPVSAAARGNPLRMTATIKNPSAIYAYTSAPVAIKVEFTSGQVPTADYVKIKNSAGTYQEFQWEGDTDLRKNGTATIATWPDGSLRSGKFWMTLSLAVGATETYTLEIYSAAQSQSFTQLVAYSVISGTVEQLDTATITYRFESAQGWLLRRMFDKALANEDYFTSQNGLCIANQTSTGVTKNSYTAIDITVNSRGRINTTAFGYGVVFQDWQVNLTWATETNMTSVITYRIFANGKLEVKHKFLMTGAVASADRAGFVWVRPQSTGQTTSVLVQPYGYVLNQYANKRILAIPLGLQGGFEETPAATASSYLVKDGTGGAQYGWSGTTAFPSGSQLNQHIYVTTGYAIGDEVGECTRARNPLVGRFSEYSTGEIKKQFARRAKVLIQDFADWYPTVSNTSWWGCHALALLALGKNGHTTSYDLWWTSNGISKTVASLLAYWTAGNGWQYIGRNTQYLHEAYRRNLLASNYVSDIHLLADFAVTIEANAGSTGSVPLSGAAADNYNAEASALHALGLSLSIIENTTRRATFNRILARFTLGVFLENWMPYDNTTGALTNLVVRSPATHYYLYQAFEVAEGCALAGVANPIKTVTAPLFVLTNSVGQIDELYATADINRRGAMSTQLFGAAALMLSTSASVSDKRQALALLDNVISNRIPNSMWSSPSDGWSYNGLLVGEAMDVRALCSAGIYA